MSMPFPAAWNLPRYTDAEEREQEAYERWREENEDEADAEMTLPLGLA